MTKVIDKRAQNTERVLFICDFSPPRGSRSRLLEKARIIDSDFIAVAYNPGKAVRVNSTLAALWIKQNTSKDVVFTIATRDMNKVAMQSLLLGASMMGLENVVIVKGDDFTPQELSLVKSVHDFRPTQLIDSIGSMNNSLDYKGSKLQTPTSFCVGATIDLGHDALQEIELTRKKVMAGAEFFLMQASFYPKKLKYFFDKYYEKYGEQLSAPVFCGVQMVTDNSIVFGEIPSWITDNLRRGREPEDISREVLHSFLDEGFKSIYLMPPILKGGNRDYDSAQRIINSVIM